MKWQYELALLKNNNDPSKISSYTDYFGEYQDMDMYSTGVTNDWQDLTYGRTGNTFNHNLNITGGSDNIKYAFSYRYDMTNVTGGGANEAAGVYDTDRRLKYSVIYYPMPVANMDPTVGADDDDLGNLYNPITSAYDNDRRKERKNLNLGGAFGWEVLDNLKLKAELGYDYYNQYDKRFWGLTTYYIKNVPTGDNQNHPAIRLTMTDRHRFRSTNTISYDFKKLFKNKDHSLNVLLGHEYVITKKRENMDEVHGFPVDYNSTTQGTPYTIDDAYSADDKLLSFFGRANYNYLDRYLLSATFRADASSKFSKENRWGYFPSAALAWRISSEPFMKGTKKWLDDLFRLTRTRQLHG